MPRKAKIDGKEAKRLFEDGEASVDELAARYGVTRSAVYQSLKREGVAFSNRKRFNPSEELGNKIVESYRDEGVAANEIGKTVGVSGNTILSFLREKSVDIRPRGRPKLGSEEDEVTATVLEEVDTEEVRDDEEDFLIP